MSNLNKQVIIGHLGRDPELKEVNQSLLVKLEVATNHSWESNGEEKTSVEWHRVDVWGPLAKICATYKKGYQVYVEGPTLSNSWEDKDGAKRYEKYIRAQYVGFLGFGSQRPAAEVPKDEIPF